ncbi:MAG: PadR family transcriptional regulator [Clostridiales bacterium]|jgi:PadR family transcriptional regulator PadR|nr:PadR family transcriptional regulator [Clostridiales bacterium]
MSFSISSKLLDAMVLSIVQREETYGYKITQDIRDAIDISESTLYPVLRRLQKDECLETYDKEYMGRNRRYYRVTSKGNELLENYRRDWFEYKRKIEKILINGVVNNG